MAGWVVAVGVLLVVLVVAGAVVRRKLRQRNRGGHG